MLFSKLKLFCFTATNLIVTAKCIFFGGGEMEGKWTMKEFSTSKIKKKKWKKDSYKVGYNAA